MCKNNTHCVLVHESPILCNSILKSGKESEGVVEKPLQRIEGEIPK